MRVEHKAVPQGGGARGLHLLPGCPGPLVFKLGRFPHKQHEDGCGSPRFPAWGGIYPTNTRSYISYAAAQAPPLGLWLDGRGHQSCTATGVVAAHVSPLHMAPPRVTSLLLGRMSS